MTLRERRIDLRRILEARGLTEGDLVHVLGVSERTVLFWRTGERKPSIEHAMTAEKRLKIPRHELRPDLWAPPPRAPKQHRFKQTGDFQIQTRELAAAN